MVVAFSLLHPSEDPAEGGDAPRESEVLSAFRKAAREHPGESDYLFLLGEASLRHGRPAEAVGWLTQAARLDPRDAPSHFALGRALMASGRLEEAVAALGETVRLEPGHQDASNALGVALLESGDAQRGWETLQALVTSAPDRAPFHSNLAVALWSLGRADEALSSFKRAVALDPSSAELRRNLGLALAAAGDANAAVAALRHAVRLRPQAALHHLDLADALYAQGRRSEAAGAYDEALSREPTCLLTRPASQQARQDLTLSTIREDLPARGGRGFAGAVLLFLVRAGAGIARAAGRRKGLDLAIAILVLVPAVRATVAVLRPWVRHHLLHDEAVRIARLPVSDHDQVLAQLRLAVRKHGLERWLDGDRCQIQSDEALRQIRCEYVVPVELLPGFVRRLYFRLHVEEPFFVEEAPILF